MRIFSYYAIYFDVILQNYNVKISISVITTNVQAIVVTVFATIVVLALVNVVGLEMIAISLLGVMRNLLLRGYC